MPLQQQLARRALESSNIFQVLRDYHPVLAGAILLHIDIPDSDLDVICETHALDDFENVVRAAFGEYTNFRIARELVRGVPSLIVNFDHAGLPIEIFEQPKPVMEQNAYRHMLVEERLLAIGGQVARVAIRALKLAGVKIEPAFARYFILAGDPYEELLRLSWLSEHELRKVVAK